MKIKSRKLRKSSLFKLIFVSQLVPMGLFFLVCGIAALLGKETVEVNGSHLTGVMGVIAAIIMYPIFLILFSSIIWVGAEFGLWTFSLFQKIELEFIDGEIVEENMQNQRLEPIVKTPVDEVEAQSTQAHP